ncbi:beta-ketoacyl synthase N-terminal-like domain-containing protein [Sphingobacterium paludis]|uniref:3-oxoacyl-[acyl-carrier-protein] synthase-1 n=1 Tax=Sphingobacterium paludis TaxID=1476465 RepID=A0A4R7D6F2_9SPHI|nr:beta-ketoacyl synthase N-terminal-like domain-containing protein [Sphingobacterium paludis]TDS14536.1 3-oxoacyl-[acyl-carrier-protein] synthase-1 [Sphingobacterium paludis]
MSFGGAVYIHDFNCFTPLGKDADANWAALVAGYGAIKPRKIGFLDEVYASQIGTSIAEVDEAVGEGRLAYMLSQAMAPILDKHRPTPRTALVLASTKGEIGYLEKGEKKEAELYRLAKKIAAKAGIRTEPIVVSHACVSGVLAINAAKRLIQMNQYDEAIVLAGDELSAFVLSGFQAFQALSPFPCKPFDADRAGVSLGEASACLFLSREPSMFTIRGEGAINDANHISGPSRTGEGLFRSIGTALHEAKWEAGAIEFIAAHGTATVYNDEMESIAFNRLGLSGVPINSLKGYYGHTLGASGLLETVITLKSMQEGILLPTLGFERLGTSQPLNVLGGVTEKKVQRVLKTASGFGGSNAAILIEKIW